MVLPSTSWWATEQIPRARLNTTIRPITAQPAAAPRRVTATTAMPRTDRPFAGAGILIGGEQVERARKGTAAEASHGS